MQEVDVDVVGSQSPKAVLEVRSQVRGDVAVCLGCSVEVDLPAGLVDLVADLGGDDRPVAPAFEGLPQDPLAVAGAVVGCGVEEGGAVLQGGVDRSGRLGVVHDSPSRLGARQDPRPADGPAAHPNRGNLNAASAEYSLHASPP